MSRHMPAWIDPTCLPQVYMGLNQDTGQIMAVKELSHDPVANSKEQVAQVQAIQKVGYLGLQFLVLSMQMGW